MDTISKHSHSKETIGKKITFDVFMAIARVCILVVEEATLK
jgi:hypothetical protein